MLSGGGCAAHPTIPNTAPSSRTPAPAAVCPSPPVTPPLTQRLTSEHPTPTTPRLPRARSAHQSALSPLALKRVSSSRLRKPSSRLPSPHSAPVSLVSLSASPTTVFLLVYFSQSCQTYLQEKKKKEIRTYLPFAENPSRLPAHPGNKTPAPDT